MSCTTSAFFSHHWETEQYIKLLPPACGQKVQIGFSSLFVT